MSLRSVTIIATILLAIGLVVFTVYFFVSKVQPTDDVGQGTQFPVPEHIPVHSTQTTSDTEAEYERVFMSYQAREMVFQKITSPQGAYVELYSIYLTEKERFPDNKVVLSVALEDLNGDGTDEAIVTLDAPGFCGTGGCHLDIYEKNGVEWSLIFSGLANEKIGVLSEENHGYQDILLSIHGDEVGYQTQLVRFIWNGMTYVKDKKIAEWNGEKFVSTP